MKKLYSLFTGLCLLGAVACHDDLSKYDTPDCRLNFIYYNSDSTLVEAADVTDEMRFYSFSFALSSTMEATRDTVWFEAGTMGFLSDETRPFALKQIQVEGKKNAEPGVHYVAFDAPETVPLYWVPGNANRVRIPVIVLRSAELSDTTVTLQFGFEANGYFLPGYEGLDNRTMEITDRLAQPANWYEPYWNGSYSLGNFIGHYGAVKHQLMIEWTGKAWDPAYIEEFMKGDDAFRDYIINKLKKKLKEENDARKAAGEEVYKEADGTEVNFEADWSI